MSKSPLKLLFAGVVLLTVGCNADVDVQQSTTSTSTSAGNATANSDSAALQQLLLSEKPEGDIHNPTDIKNAEGESVVGILAGRIDAGEQSPFQAGQLSFMVSQLPEEGHADDPDHADNCPFCARRLKNAPKAMVTFVGPDGAAIGGDAQEGLGLSKGDIVYVVGSAQYNKSVNTVLVKADAVFREPSH